MVKLDHPPLLAEGYITIGAWQLDEYFLKPFQDQVIDTTRRTHLINNLNLYLRELRKFNIPIELWIDGSFTTRNPDPQDIDLVVWAKESDIDALPEPMLVYFGRLTTSKVWVRLQYDIDVYLGKVGIQREETYYDGIFSKGHLAFSKKGYFKLILTNV